MTLHRSNARSEVGIRELHDHLSRYVSRVAEGEEITVTMRGRPVARLTPLEVADPLADFRRRGLVTEPTLPPDLPPDRPRPKQPVSDLVAEQRR